MGSITKKSLISIGIGLAAFLLLSIFYTPAKPASYALKAQLSLKKAQPPTAPVFIDKTIELGFHTEHRQRDSKISGLDQIYGAGACALDYDQDGWKDILIIAGSGIGHYFGKPKWWQAKTGNVLYRNINGQHFEAQENVLPNTSGWGMNCTAADFDNDGDPDLFISNKGANQLLENKNGIFEAVPTTKFSDQNLWTSSAVITDLDLDGLLDLYLVNYIDYAPDKRYLEQSAGYKGTEEALFEPELFEPLPNQLLRNLGSMQFEDITAQSGTGDISGRGVTAQWGDINNDNQPDLLISNDEGSPSKLFINKGNYQFDDQSSLYGISSSESQRTMLVVKNQNSHEAEILIGGNSESQLSLLKTSPVGAARELTNTGDLSRLIENTQSIGIGDFNLDGVNDLYLANGLLSPDMDRNSHAQAQNNRLLLGQANNTYLDCSEHCLTALHPVSSRYTLVEDFDKDGDLDILETANNDLVRYLENQHISKKEGFAEPELALKSKLTFESPPARLLISDWLILDNKNTEAIHELSLLANSELENSTDDLAINISTGALNKLAHIPDPDALGPLVKALRSPNNKIRKAAVDALRIQEVDYTGRYLIPLLQDSSDEVKCAVADSFSYFYDEEEAMIRSKYLATSVLVKSVSESMESTPICFIKALGKSESYRALNPLLKLAKSNNPETESAAISAIKLLKEQHASLVSESSRASDALFAVTEFEKIHTEPAPLCNADPKLVDNYRNANALEKRNLREWAKNLSTNEKQRIAVLEAMKAKPLLSEYRLAQFIFNNEEDSLRFCATPTLLSYAPESHLGLLIQSLKAKEITEQNRLIIANAIRQYDPELIWDSLLKE